MSSGQHPSGSSAASKFNLVELESKNEEKSIQEAVTDEVNSRMEKAVDDLRTKYETGGRGFNASHDNKPTGTAYQREREEKKKQQDAICIQEKSLMDSKKKEEEELQRQLIATNDGADSDDEYLNEFDEDPEIIRIREERLKLLKATNEERIRNLAKGHGTFREISQDEFLPEVTGSQNVVVHFYHGEFQKCKIMDMHLERLALQHIESKFIKINAEKAPFFVQKLCIKVLPCVIVFRNGISIAEIKGFEGLNESQEMGKEDEWPTINLAKRLALLKAITYTAKDSMDEERQFQSNIIIREGLNSEKYYSDDDD